MTTTTTTYWCDDNGTVYCEDHAGNYLRCAIKNNPAAREHHTPLGTWERMTAQDVVDFQAFIDARLGGGSVCEQCRDRY